MASKLTFVVHSGPASRELRDPDIRYHIRQKAMKNVALTRKKRSCKTPGRSLRKNSKTSSKCDKSSSDESEESSAGVLSSEDGKEDVPNLRRLASIRIGSTCPLPVEKAQQQIQSRTRLASLPSSSSSYESARARYQVDITDFSLLTHFNISRGTIMILAADPARLKTLMCRSAWSYLHFVPRYYGSEDCLTAATNCVLQKVKGILVNDEKEKSHEMELYSKALFALQTALCDKSKVDTSAVLCATQLLSLHELLSFDRKAAWACHVRGTERLFMHRGPERCRSVFDQAMFAAHIGQAVLEACFDAKPCYLESPDWLELYRSYATPADEEHPWLTPLSPLAIEIRYHMILMPGVWCDVDKAVASDDFSSMDGESALAIRCRELHAAFYSWIDDYTRHCESMTQQGLVLSQKEIDMRRELFGTALECLVIVKRLFAALCDEERPVLEAEAAATACHIVDLQAQPTPLYWWLFGSAEMNIAQSILTTTDAWSGLAEYDTRAERQERMRECYSEWNSMLRVDPLTRDV